MTSVFGARPTSTAAASKLQRVVVLQWLLSASLAPLSFSLSLSPPLLSRSRNQFSRNSPLASTPSDVAVEALHSLTDFHEGLWQGVATSFSVTNDVAAGVVQRKTSDAYTVAVTLGADPALSDYTLTETITVDGGEACRRKIALSNCNMDVDSVDASYSLDVTLPDFPSALAGTQKLQYFGIEHCLATSDNERARCFAFYGTDEQLSRIVLCHEERVGAESSGPPPPPPTDRYQLTARDLIEMRSDIDRIVDRITGGNSTLLSARDSTANVNGRSFLSSQSELDPLNRFQAPTTGESSAVSATPLARYNIGLLEISAGVWHGDAVIRDVPMVLSAPKLQKSFGGSASSGAQQPPPSERIPFGSWTVGVQKLAWRWMWNFGEEIRQVIDAGRSMGAELSRPLGSSMAGSICANEGLSSRIPKSERVVYIDWEGDNVGFLYGCVSIQVPRFLKFDSTRRVRPFYTEFSVFQSADGEPRPAVGNDISDVERQLPEVICSKISRVYNYEGKLKQGVTSFFSLQRFGGEDEPTV